MSIPWRKLVFASLGIDIALTAHEEFMKSLNKEVSLNKIVQDMDIDTARQVADYAETRGLNFMNALREIIGLIEKGEI